MSSIDITDCINTANHLVFENSSNDMFVTLFYGVLDIKAKTMNYINAGHNYPVLLKQDGNTKYLFEGGLPLGVDEKPVYNSGKVQMSEKEILVLYTDGITETFNKENKQYGEERLLNVLVAGRALCSQNMVDKIIDDVSAFRGEADIFDDSSVIVMKCLQ